MTALWFTQCCLMVVVAWLTVRQIRLDRDNTRLREAFMRNYWITSKPLDATEKEN